MKEISARLFFTVLWRGLRQAVRWFLGLFGYKRGGTFAKWVWRAFAFGAAVLMLIAAYNAASDIYKDKMGELEFLRDYAYSGVTLSAKLSYVNEYDGRGGYVIDRTTGHKFIRGIDWIALPLGNDSIVCFSKDGLRGYFNAHDGSIVVKPKYEHAWIFSNGLAAVEEDGKILFIDSTGKVTFDSGMTYNPHRDGYVFHGGYLQVSSHDGQKYGLMDRTGNLALPIEYDEINIANSLNYWAVCKDGVSTVYDKDLKVLLPPTKGSVCFEPRGFTLVKSDHTISHYAYDGTLLNDFCVTSVHQLSYDTDEYVYPKNSGNADSESGEYATSLLSPERKMATARLRCYTAGHGFEGLMTPDGHIVTLPLYKNIEAIGPDTYLCSLIDDVNVVLNGQGQEEK